MQQSIRIAGLALAVLAAAALPLDSAMADKGGKHKGDHYSYSYGRPHHGKHHHHHHDRRPVVVVAPPRYRHPRHHHHHHDYWGGSTLGFVYDSWTDSWRIGGSYNFR
jgi:hypothetical protein